MPGRARAGNGNGTVNGNNNGNGAGNQSGNGNGNGNGNTNYLDYNQLMAQYGRKLLWAEESQLAPQEQARPY